ncbi:MAG: hypothetical protein AAFP76_05890 [Bacteroidota bacterium]
MKKNKILRSLLLIVFMSFTLSCSTEDTIEPTIEADLQHEQMERGGGTEILYIEWEPGVREIEKNILRAEYAIGKGKIKLVSYTPCHIDPNVEEWEYEELICRPCKDDPKGQAQNEDDVDRASYETLCL